MLLDSCRRRLHRPPKQQMARTDRAARHGLVPCRRPHGRDHAASRSSDIVRAPGGPPSKLDPNGHYQVEQMYVQYFLPQNRKGKLPLLMWHGGGLTGATYETTPDGREGWLNMFIRKGWDVYVSDAVERGRSGFATPDVWTDEPIFLTTPTRSSAFASARRRLLERRPGQAQADARKPVPGRGL